MTPIIFDQFGGLIPKLNKTKLPDNAAQTALNTELRGGTISPLTLSGPFSKLWSGSYLSNVNVPAADVVQIGKPSAPGSPSKAYICQPEWLWIWKTDWLSYIDASGEKITGMLHAPERISAKAVVMTESSMWLVGTFIQRNYTLNYNSDRVLTLSGPRFQFGFESDHPGHALGGPDSTTTYPPFLSEFDPVFPEISVPLIDSNENVYANASIGDYLGPIYDEELLVMDYDSIDYYVPGQATGVGTWWAAFRIDMNYTNPRRKHLYYVQSRVTNTKEGPPSDLSDRITVLPGQRLTLNVESGAKLYRSTTGRDDFLLVDDMTSSSYTDVREQTQDVEIPPYGDAPTTDYSTFLRGAFMHPSQFAVALYDNTLYMSDQFRPWAWPDEYTIPFQSAFAHILTGNSILVFETDSVWIVSGSNPEQMSKMLLSQDHLLLSIPGLCRIGQTIFWPTSDGLAATSGGQIEIITSKYYTREQWLALEPSTMKCQTADGAILVECSDGTLLRFDYDEDLSAITTYGATLPAPFTWKSKLFDFKDPITFDTFQIRADGEITVTIYADGATAYSAAVSDADHVTITDPPHARTWEVQFEGESTIRSFSMYERVVRTIQGTSVVLNNENTPCWRMSRMKFQDPDRFVAGTLSKQSSSATLTLTADLVAQTPISVTSGKWFTVPRSVPDAVDWIVDVNADRYIDELILYSKAQVQAGKAIRETNTGPIPPWLLKIYEIPGDSRLRSGKVHASSAVTMNIYYDGAETPSESIAISDRGEFKITLQECGFFEIDFGGSDSDVYEVSLFLQEVMTIGNEGIALSDLQNKRGLLFRFAEPHTFACGLLGADLASYVGGITMSLYADGVLAYPLSGEEVTTGQVFRFPRDMARGILWEVDIATEHKIDTLILKPWTRTSADQIAVTGLAQHGGIPEWMYTEYEFGAPVKLRSGIIRSATYPLTLNLYVDQATTPTLAFTPVEDDHEFRFTSGIWANTLSFALTDEGDVRDVMLFNEEVIPVEGNGVVLRPASGRPAWRNKVLQFKDLGSFVVARCVASSYDTLTMKLYANGSLQGTKDINDEDDVSLSSLSLPRAKEWDLDIEHNGDIRELVLIGDDYTMFDDRSVMIRKENDPFTWIRKRVSSRVPIDFSCIRVLADDYPVTVRFYNGTTLKKTAVVNDEKPMRLERVRPERTWIIDVVPSDSDAQITEVAIGTSMASLVK